MDIVIRENIEKYMADLKQWPSETENSGLEEMDQFFTNRIGGYENHMMVWKQAYRRFAELLPENCSELLDLGCGTGLELDEIWRRNPDIAVTGVDLCQSMLDGLLEKHRDKTLKVICRDYFQYEFGKRKWDAVVSFESLHHFLPARKKVLYEKICESLKPGGQFILGDYLACCEEEETLLRNVYLEKRKRFHVPEECFVHFDIPLTLEHEVDLLSLAGFGAVKAVECIDGAVILVIEK